MRRVHRRPPEASERGAVAVEFALLMPLLAAFLFGIIQYGYGLFQYQAFSSAMNDASRVVATGVDGCTRLTGMVAGLVNANGLPVSAEHPLDVSLRWLGPDGATAAAAPQRLGFAELTATYHEPLNFHVPLIPFPDRFTMSKQALIQDLVPGITENLSTCAPATAP